MQAPPQVGRIDVHFPESYYRVPVDVAVNGQRVFRTERFGGEIPVPPGRHTVTCESCYPGLFGGTRYRFGAASLAVDVHPGQVVPVFYAPPHSTISKPAFGRTPHRRRLNLTPLGWIGLGAVLVASVLTALYG